MAGNIQKFCGKNFGGKNFVTLKCFSPLLLFTFFVFNFMFLVNVNLEIFRFCLGGYLNIILKYQIR